MKTGNSKNRGKVAVTKLADVYSVDEITDALKWLHAIGALRRVTRKWFVSPGARGKKDGVDTWIHSRRDCPEIEAINGITFLAEHKTVAVAPEFGLGDHAMCETCGYDAFAKNRTAVFVGQACLLHQADEWCRQVTNKRYVGVGEQAPKTHGKLVATVTDQILGDLARYRIHPGLRKANDWVRTRISESRRIHPYTDNEVLAEMTLLGAKAAISDRATRDMDKHWPNKDKQLGVFADWLRAIVDTGESAATKATLRLRKTAKYRNLTKTFPELPEMVENWEKFYTKTVENIDKMAFFKATGDWDRLDLVPTNLRGTTSKMGAKAHDEHCWLGELPLLALKWLQSDTVSILSEPYGHLSTEQWRTAMSLYTEHFGEVESVYSDPGKAITAASKL